MSRSKPVVRAVDVGYGHVKWSEGRDESGLILADAFPSQAPLALENDFQTEIMQRRDTFVVPVNEIHFEVGRQVRMAFGKNQELEQLDDRFALSDGYTARLYGAFNYMLSTLPSRSIDYLMLGLPMKTLKQHSVALQRRFVGEHTINLEGEKFVIEHCAVYPQPLGSYATYLQKKAQKSRIAPMALIVDVGYHTVDWITCLGMVANPDQSDGVERGMGAFLREVAKSVIKASGMAANESTVVRMLDQSLITGEEFRLAGKEIDLKPHLRAGNGIIEQAAQAVRNNVGVGEGLDVVIVSGGGARFFLPAIKKHYPSHEVTTLPAPALANVRGFHQFGELIADSARRATAQA